MQEKKVSRRDRGFFQRSRRFCVERTNAEVPRVLLCILQPVNNSKDAILKQQDVKIDYQSEMLIS